MLQGERQPAACRPRERPDIEHSPICTGPASRPIMAYPTPRGWIHMTAWDWHDFCKSSACKKEPDRVSAGGLCGIVG